MYIVMHSDIVIAKFNGKFWMKNLTNYLEGRVFSCLECEKYFTFLISNMQAL